MTALLAPFQAKLAARELLMRHPAGQTASLSAALMDAQVDLNPHQVEAALFAFRSPFSKGAILADEVGLGKTIEAGLVITQRWAEQRRRVLIIAPASLRKQWAQELADKFFIRSVILESKSFNDAVKQGIREPFMRSAKDPAVIICSYQFAAKMADEVMATPWDLVVCDEAHRLRNVYKPGNKIAVALRTALVDRPKLLLTATPLQNTLMELYGLVSFVDEHTFGDVKSFRTQYARLVEDGSFDDLKARLAPVCHRTLRRQVVEYVKYTNRVPITQEFKPTPDELQLYDMVSDYLRRPELQALPASQRTLMVLVMRKLLASSTFAIAGALGSLALRLRGQLKTDDGAQASLRRKLDDAFADQLGADFEQLNELVDEWPPEGDAVVEPLSASTRASIGNEIAELEAFRDVAVSITENAKGTALLSALTAGFSKAAELGAKRRAVVFTESCRTQEYLVRLLETNGYAGKLVLFNGSNADPASAATYKAWVQEHKGGSKISGSRSADMRSALVDRFRDDAEIMIATEAAAEGINLQFCSIVVNYDLPWNPQRIEQRIGRCHRYGQKHDVVVINFLNQSNAAEQRVFELLDEKFQLFSGVFGASDEVLGAIESGLDFERRVASIFQSCRSNDEIEAEFTQLRLDLETEITTTMDDTRKKLLENFDSEVHDRLKVSLRESQEYLNRSEQQLWNLAKAGLANQATFDTGRLQFTLNELPIIVTEVPVDVPLGHYSVSKTADDDVHRFRSQHPLAQFVIHHAANLNVGIHEVTLDYTGWAKTSEAMKTFLGRSGAIEVAQLTVDGADIEDHLLFIGVTDDGETIPPDVVRRILDLPASGEPRIQAPDDRKEGEADAVAMRVKHEASEILRDVGQRQGVWFDAEMEKLDRWAEDKRAGLKAELRDLDNEIKELKKQARQAANLPDKLAVQKKIKTAETSRDQAWRSYDDEAKTVDQAKDDIIGRIEARLSNTQTTETLFRIHFRII
jgi:superfamily II DNA or RNA helicase